MNRRNIAEVFANVKEVEVVGKAADGEDALRQATMLKPDVITLDLEMPKMDGFTFLRILMSKQPTPVIVVSSYAQKENVFKALELGALDFVTKPDQRIPDDAHETKDQIKEKVLMVRALRTGFAPPSRRVLSGNFQVDPRSESVRSERAYVAPRHLVAIGSSTGGPSALLEVFGKIPQGATSAVVVAQHMPDKFTRTFAERLDKRGTVRTREAEDGDKISRGTGFVCPGRQCMEVVTVDGELRLKVGPADAKDKYVPSADRLLSSAARAMGSRAVGLVLTGMGDDGLVGARAIREAGGTVVAEAQETAVVYGMPGAVVKAGLATHVLPLPEIADFVANLAV
jgi:two-component system chemotaxis response regulator CheB